MATPESAIPSDVELYTVAPDEIAITFVTAPDVEVVTRIGDVDVTTTGPYHHVAVTGLEPSTEYVVRVEGAEPTPWCPEVVATLSVPPGRLRARFATANDVHFGEQICGLLGTEREVGPVFTTLPGSLHYPQLMNRAAVREIEAGGFDAVLVKGDLTSTGSAEEYEQFLGVWGAFGDRLHHVRGNHDVHDAEHIAGTGPFTVEVAGAVLAMLDTSRVHEPNGYLDDHQLEWLDDLAGRSTEPILVFGHHHPWDPMSDDRNPTYFGIVPDHSEALCEVMARHDNIHGFFAGHTHRNRVRHFRSVRGVPVVEVASLKEYPGAWAEYRVYDGGYVQIGRRIAGREARAWTERTRRLFAGLYREYALGSVGDRCFTWQW